MNIINMSRGLLSLDAADKVLLRAELDILAITMALERASNFESSPLPSTPQDFLAWIEDEAKIQEEQAAGNPAERIERMEYARRLRDYASELRCLGIKPSLLPFAASS